MKTLLFDLFEAQPALTSKFHGGGEYIKAVFENLIKKYWGKYKLIVFYDQDKFLDDWIINILKDKEIKTYFVKIEEDIKYIFKKEKIDVFYSGLPYYYKRDYIPKNVKIIGTIHGLRFLELPADKYAYLYTKGEKSLKEKIRYYGKNIYKQKKYQEFLSCIDLLDVIVCVSNHTRFSVLKNFPKYKDRRIHVLYTPQKKANKYVGAVLNEEQKFILLLGGDRWIKNCYREIIALEELFQNGYLKNYKVVVVGGLSDHIRHKISNFEKYDIRNYVETEELEELYSKCDIFLYASLNEGFGMPPLEAMKYGTTCVISGVCSLPEVCGDAVYYVNPYDVDEIAGRILNAAAIKINEDKVIAQFQKIYERQKEDLNRLCELIIQ